MSSVHGADQKWGNQNVYTIEENKIVAIFIPSPLHF